jgi:tetratricopeptide (TPR) repeat protein
MSENRRVSNPYPGLRPFETDEYLLFFGREGQSDALVERLERSRFLAVVGTSGSGKSSLVRAGLLPALRGGMMSGAGAGWRVAIMRPGHDPIGNLARELAAGFAPAADDSGKARQGKSGKDEGEAEKEARERRERLRRAEVEAVAEATLRRGSLGLVEAAYAARLGEREKLLVVVDQFEELFRFRAARAGAAATDDDAAAFVKLLLEAARQRELPVYVVLTMRSDFLGDCAQLQGLPEAINDGQYLIPRLTRDERRVAIVGPARVARGKMTEPLVNRLLNDVGDNPDQLPILQHALMRTWDYWLKHRSGSEPVGLEHYLAVGTMSEALSLHADEAFNELPDERSRRVAELLFKSLTERGSDNREVRRPTRLGEICEVAEAGPAEVAAVVEVFRREGRSFLMPPAGVALTPDTVIDISHESLIRNWTRLREWVRDEAEGARIYRRLADAAAAYRAGEGGLLDDVTLGWVNRWRERYQPNRAWGVRYHAGYDEALEYLEESRAARAAEAEERERQRASEVERERREREQAEAFAERQRRTARRMRWLAVGMAVMFILAFGGAAYAYRMGQRAQENEKAAVLAREAALKAQADAQKSEREARDLARSLNDAKADTDKALEAEKKAVAEQDKALKEQQAATARARDEAEKAHQAEQAALRAKKKADRAKEDADKAREDAVLNADILSVSRERTNLHLSGVAAFRRGNYYSALSSLEKARRLQEAEEKKQKAALASSGEPADVEVMGADDVGYQKLILSADIGATMGRLGRHEEAIREYESTLSFMLKKTGDRPLDSGRGVVEVLWMLFDIRHQLGHAYRDYAEDFAGAPTDDEKGAEEAQRKIKEANEKAKENFKEAVRFQEMLLKFEDEAKAATHAGGFQSLTRLLSDLGEFKEAEPYYKRMLEIRKAGHDNEALGEALQETAQFYASQNRYHEAEALYNEAINLHRGSDDDLAEAHEKSDTHDMKLAELYGELGEIYAGNGEEEKATLAFRLVNLYQSLGRGGAGSTEKLLEIGDTYEKLGRPNWAAATYQRLLGGSGTNNATRTTALIKLAAVTYNNPINWAKAESLYRQALRLSEQPGGSPDLRARVMRQLGVLYVDKSDAPAAAKLSEDWLNGALAYWEQQQNQREIYGVLSDLAALYRREKQADKLLAVERREVEVGAAILARSRHPRQMLADAQEALNAAGFSAGAADGVAGPRALLALRKFQESKQLPATGQLDAATAAALGLKVEWAASGSWDAGKYAEAFALYVSAVGNLTDDLLANGRKDEATEAAKLLLDARKLGVGQVSAPDALDSYVALLEKYREQLQPGRNAGLYAQDERAEMIQEARERRREVEQIARGQDYQIAGPCPYPLAVNAPEKVGDGDIVTFTADVGYQGQSPLKYVWTVSPSTARITSGAGTPSITVDSSGLGNKSVTALLVADDGSGERSCRQTAYGETAVAPRATKAPPPGSK